jgi:predicted AAA+ superfamily ATPase
MKRSATGELSAWLSRRGRKPLVIRGARQVGKSYLIRDFATTRGLDLVELNFERDPRAAKLFEDGDAARMLRGIEAFTGQRLVHGRSLLFLDEIQAAPHVLAKLRWLHEETPKLAVVAAGSLLDFALADHTFSMPVGRITYLHLEPMSFTEFLCGLGEDELAATIEEIDPWGGITEPLHARILDRFREYILVGGMPEAVETYRQDRSLLDCSRVHQDLLATFRDDFAKYAGSVHRDRLIKILEAVPRMIGRKFVYTRVDRDERAAALRQAVDLLCRARVCHRVEVTHATGVPLAADSDDRRYKLLMIDVGLVSASLGLSLGDLERADDLVMANEGAIAEQAVGQALRLVEPPFHEPKLHYWARDTRGSEAEVDYVLQQGTRIVPIEVKAGATGTLRSLHVLMATRGWKRALRFNADRPSATPVSTIASSGERASYELLSLPLYLAANIGRIVHDREPRRRAR